MDTEEGVEVVWNEVQFSERKNFKAQEEKIQLVFENLTQLEHPNIVKFHRYWTDTHNDKPRVSYKIYAHIQVYTILFYKLQIIFIHFTGYIYNRIYVIWILETVPKTNQT